MFITVESSAPNLGPLLFALGSGVPLLVSFVTSLISFLQNWRKRKFTKAQRLARKLERGHTAINPRSRQD